MPTTMPQPDRRALPEKADKCAKAHLRKAADLGMVERVGASVERARQLRGWTLDKLAREACRDERQIARWIKAEERTQFDVLFAIPDDDWRNALIAALAELGTGVEVETVIRVPIKRTA